MRGIESGSTYGVHEFELGWREASCNSSTFRIASHFLIGVHSYHRGDRGPSTVIRQVGSRANAELHYCLHVVVETRKELSLVACNLSRSQTLVRLRQPRQTQPERGSNPPALPSNHRDPDKPTHNLILAGRPCLPVLEQYSKC